MSGRGFAVWLTGLPASGKSALASALRKELITRGLSTLIVDSDELRLVLTPQPGYTENERDWFYRTLVKLVGWLTDSGINVLIAATGSRRDYRQAVRERVARFAEVYVRCSLETCIERDPKGIYARALAGSGNTVPGLGVPYEPPPAPEAVVDTSLMSPEEAAASVLAQLETAGFCLSADSSPSND